MPKKNSDYWAFFVIAAAILLFLFFLGAFFLKMGFGGDTEWYIAAAEGRLNEIIEPYSSRFLHPFIAGGLSGFFSLDVHWIFIIMTVTSVFLFFVINIVIIKNNVRSPLLIIPLFLSPYFFTVIRKMFQPDPLYLFLTALFFLLLIYRKEILSIFVLFLLFLTRESTLVLGLLFALLSWWRSKKLLTIAIIVVVIISLFIMSIISNISQPNIHGLQSSAYLALKFGYNFMTNIFGLEIWINTAPLCKPLVVFRLPPFEFLGDVKEIGFCGFNPFLPLQTAIVLLTTFGIAPLVVFYVLAKKLKYILKEWPFWMLLALTYGLANYFLGPSAGSGVQRIVGYGWPAFIMLAPFFVQGFFEIDKTFIIKLVLAQLFVAWLPFIIHQAGLDSISVFIAALAVIGAIYFYIFRLLKTKEKTAQNLALSPSP